MTVAAPLLAAAPPRANPVAPVAPVAPDGRHGRHGQDDAADPGGAPLRLLHVYSGNLYGGVERLLETLHARGADLGADARQDFALCFPGRVTDRLRDAGAPVVDLGPVRRRAPWTRLRARRRLAACVRAAAAAGRPYDLVLFHAFWPLALLGGGVPRVGTGAVPRAVWVHDDPDPSHWTFRGAVRAGADAAIFNSEFVRGRPASKVLLEGLEIPPERACVIRPPASPPPPASADRRKAVRAALGVSEGEALILVAARFDSCKGHALLLDALGRLAAGRSTEGRIWSCAIAGGSQRPSDKAQVATLKAQAERLGITDRLRWLGHRDDVPDLMAAADVYCQPNVTPESFGIVFVEALYAGCPVVTTAIGGGREILRPTGPAAGTDSAERTRRGAATVGGRLTGIDADAVAEALRALIADPARRRRLAAAGPARAAALCDPASRLAELGAFCRGVRSAAAPSRAIA